MSTPLPIAGRQERELEPGLEIEAGTDAVAALGTARSCRALVTVATVSLTSFGGELAWMTT